LTREQAQQIDWQAVCERIVEFARLARGLEGRLAALSEPERSGALSLLSDLCGVADTIEGLMREPKAE
jgi:hypothetical protein